MRSAFIVLFFSFAVFDFACGRDDWPFGKFGMYSEFFSGGPKCVYTLSARIVDGPAVKLPNQDWIVQRLYLDHDCEALVHGRTEFPRARHDEIFRVDADDIFEHAQGEALDIEVRLALWSAWRAENLRRPDVERVLYARRFSR